MAGFDPITERKPRKDRGGRPVMHHDLGGSGHMRCEQPVDAEAPQGTYAIRTELYTGASLRKLSSPFQNAGGDAVLRERDGCG